MTQQSKIGTRTFKYKSKLKIRLVNVIILTNLIALINSEITLQSYQAEEALALFTMKTYSIYCAEGKTTLIINYRHNGVCERFLQHAGYFGLSMPFYSYKLTNNIPFQGEHEGGKADLTLLFLNGYNITNIDFAWKEIEDIPLYQSFSKYLLVFSSKPPNDTLWVEAIFKFLWTKKILRVFITFWDKQIKVYTFNPFRNEYCIDITHVNDEKKKFFLEFELFDLNGYPLRVFIWDGGGYRKRVEEKINNGNIEYVGYDGKLLTQVRNILNVTIDMIKESQTNCLNTFKETLKNTSSPRSLYAPFLKKYDLDIFFTATRAKSGNIADDIFLQERDDYVILVPVGEKVPEYLYIFLLIRPTLLFLTILHIIVVSLTLYLIRYFRQLKSNYSDSIFDVYKIIINIPMTGHNDNFQERVILCVWMVFSIMFSVVFNSTMVSNLVVPKYYLDLNKIEDLVKTNITIYTTYYEYKLVQQALTGNDVKLLSKIEVSFDKNFSTSIYSYQNESGFMMRAERAREFLKVTKKIGRIRYNIMNEHPLPNAQSYLMPRGHPYIEEIQWIVHKVHESGLWYEWRKTDYGRENMTTGTDVGETVYDDTYIYLRLIHLQSIFYMLAFGHFIAFLVFCGEYLSQKTNIFKT